MVPIVLPLALVLAASPVQDTGLSRETIARVIGSKRAELKGCHERSLTENPNVAGEVRVLMVIGSDGAVVSSTVKSDTTGSPSLGRCLAAVVKTAKFPALEGTSVMTIEHPFVFKRP